jgi:transcriptional regulator with XRE-family HTH domain
MDDGISFGSWVRRLCRALDLSQQALAQQVGCARVTIQKIEAGERRPSREFAVVLTERLSIPPGEERVTYVQERTRR